MKFQLVEIETYFPIRFVCVNILEFSIFFLTTKVKIKNIFSVLNLVVDQLLIYLILQYLCGKRYF